MKKLSNLSYRQLANYQIYSKYKLCAISHAAGILANRKKSQERGYKPRQPYARRPFPISCYGFKIIDGVLKVPIGNRQYFEISLNNYAKNIILSDPALQVRSFTLTANNTISICYLKEVTRTECTTVEGIDRILDDVTVGNIERIVQYDLSKATMIVENTRSII